MVNFLMGTVGLVFLGLHLDHLATVAAATEAAEANYTPEQTLEGVGTELTTFRWTTDFFYHVEVSSVF